jgi:hypothetical protein
MTNHYRNAACPHCHGTGWVSRSQMCHCDNGVTPTLWAVRIDYFKRRKWSKGMDNLMEDVCNVGKFNE